MSDVPERLRIALAERYEVQQEIGRGGMATVFVATDRKHDRQVALKVLKPELALVVGAERFVREIRIAASLRHPNILPLYDSGDADGTLYYTMPYVPGESLRGRLTRERQLSLEDAMVIALEVADALAHAHSHGIVHRDIKPENILLEAGHAVVADFGIARAVGDMEGRLTETGLAVGTPAYMSPEQAGGTGEVDARTDQYALGCVLYEMLAGEPPHTGPTPQAVLARSLTEDVRSLRPVRRTVSPELDDVIRRALAPTPADRYATCHEFADALRAAAGVAPSAGPGSGSRAQLVRRVLGPTLAVLGIVALGLFGRRLLTPSPAVAASRLGLAVFPLRETDPGTTSLSEWLGDLLSTALDGTPGVRVADTWSLWHELRPNRTAGAAPPDPVEGARLAAEAGARHYVLGALLQRGDQLDVTLRLYAVGTAEPTHTLMASGNVSDLPALVQELAAGVIARLWEEEQLPEVRDVRGYTTRSADALKAYLEARLAFRRGMLDSAVTAIDQALALDSNFALALVEAVRIKSWSSFARGQPYAGLTTLVDRATQFSDSLSERNRARVTATRAQVYTDGPTAVAAARRILEIDSTDIDGWGILQYTHAAYGWQYGATPADARVAAERMVALDPTFVPAAVLRAWQAVASADTLDVAAQIERLRQLDTTGPLAQSALRNLRVVLAGDSAFAAALPGLAAQPPVGLIATIRALRTTRPARAVQVLEAARAGPPGPARDVAEGALVQLWVAQGRLRYVDSLLQAGAYASMPGLRLSAQFWLVAADLAGVGDRDAALRARRAMEAYLPPDSAAAYLETRPVWWGGWLIAAHHATYGDTAVTRQWSRALNPLPRDGTSEDWVGALQADFAARLAARRGDAEAALAQEERAYRLWTIHTDNQFESLPEPAMRLHLGVLLAATGRPDSAEAFLSSLVPPTTWMGFLSARAWFELGALAERREAYHEAASYFGRALELWEGGGEEIRPWRDRAREAVNRALRRAG